MSHTLPDTGVLASVSPAARTSLQHCGSLAELPRGSVVVAQGSPATSLHIVLSGELAVMLQTPEELVPLGYVHPGDSVGEMGFLDPSAIASAEVNTRMASTVWSITGEAFEAFIQNQPLAAAEILKALLLLTSRRAQKNNQRLVD